MPLHRNEISAKLTPDKSESTGLSVLVLADLYQSTASTVWDHCLSFRRYSKHRVFYFNPVWKDKPVWLQLNAFSVVVIHYSVFSLHEAYLNAGWRAAIANCQAIKIQFIQDEYRNVNLVNRFLEECRIDILYTCIPQGEIGKLYPNSRHPRMVKVNTLTGYVPDYLTSRRFLNQTSREIDVGYRARGEGFWWLGELFQEKYRIGVDFLKKSKPFGIKCDISSKESDRLYGEDWLRFLQNCKATLGTESGASVIDWDGHIEQAVTQYCREHPKATFAQVQRKILRKHEGKVKMNQISPRIFEAIGCGTLLILFEGEYSGILKPNLHYVPLKKDFSNIKSVLSILQDEQKRKKITEQAYRDIIESGNYSYRAFVKNFDETVTTFLRSRASREPIRAQECAVSPTLLEWSDPYIAEYDLNDPTQLANWPARAKLAYKRLFSAGSRPYRLGEMIWHRLRTMRRAYRVWRDNVFRNRWFWREKPKIFLHVLTYLAWRKYVQHSRHR